MHCNGLYMKSSVQKGLSSTFGRNWLLSGIPKTAHFDTNFTFLAYSFSLRQFPEFSGKFRIFEQFWPFISKNNVHVIFFLWEIIDGNVIFKIRPKESTLGMIFILKLRNLWNLWFFQNCSKLTFLTKNKNKHNTSKSSIPILMRFPFFI